MGLSRICCRYTLAAVFLMAAVTKITDLRGFADQVVLHSGLSPTVALAFAAILPWLELTCAACLLFGQAKREAALLLSILLFLLLAYSLTHLGEADCGCFLFPSLQSLSSPKTLTAESLFSAWWWPPVRNFLLLLCSVWVTWRQEMPSK